MKSPRPPLAKLNEMLQKCSQHNQQATWNMFGSLCFLVDIHVAHAHVSGEDIRELIPDQL